MSVPPARRVTRLVGRKRLALIILALVAASLSWTTRSDAASPALDGLASQMVGHSVTVECFPDESPDARLGLVGFVWPDDPSTVHVIGSYCGALESQLRGSRVARRYLSVEDHATDFGAALATLLHESLHLRLQSDDEGQVECAAYRNVWPYLAAFHLSPRANRAVWAGIVWDHRGLPADYLTVC